MLSTILSKVFCISGFQDLHIQTPGFTWTLTPGSAGAGVQCSALHIAPPCLHIPLDPPPVLQQIFFKQPSILQVPFPSLYPSSFSMLFPIIFWEKKKEEKILLRIAKSLAYNKLLSLSLSLKIDGSLGLNLLVINLRLSIPCFFPADVIWKLKTFMTRKSRISFILDL